LSKSFVKVIDSKGFMLWRKIEKNRSLLSFDLEVTARCNLNCKHCYINLPVKNREAKDNEPTFSEIKKITEEAVSLGALFCLITGGEPLLRRDFFDIYLFLKKKGLLVSVFTNATLINKDHIKLFKKYPPECIETTVYGVTKDTFESITRKPGSFAVFMKGLNLLLSNQIKVNLKAVALRSNLDEFYKIVRFCEERIKGYFRFDPFLILRLDNNKERNTEIKEERLTPKEIAKLEQQNPQRLQVMEKNCDKLINPGFSKVKCNHIFHCGAGKINCTIGYNGFFRLCPALNHPDCIYDLRKGTVTEAWNNFVPQIRNFRSDKKEFFEKCRICGLFNLCMWCPANAYLETGKLDGFVKYFCEVAHARKRMLKK